MHLSFKFISKQFAVFLGLLGLLIVLNIFAFIAAFHGIVSNDYSSSSPQQIITSLSGNVSSRGLTQDGENLLSSKNIWALYIDLDGNTTWTFNTPSDFPAHFTIMDIAVFSKGYLYDYPTFLDAQSDGLLVLGYPKTSFIKLLNNYFSLNAIKKLPGFFFLLLIFDFIFIFILYIRSKNKLALSISPILNGIKSLSNGDSVTITPTGELSEIAESLNKVSLILNKQNEYRANWIAGVSHDIRTPLSLILGYSSKIKTVYKTDNDLISYSEIITKNSLKIKDLISDLNIVSMLEYDMQPLHITEIRLSKLLRSFVADCINSGLDERYSVSLIIPPDLEQFTIPCNERLFTRALSNIINNSIHHNSQGCNITIELIKISNTYQLIIEDDGIGISDEEYKRLNASHTTEVLDESLDLRHGLGMIIVRRAIEAQHGFVEIPHTEHGFKTIIHLDNQ